MTKKETIKELENLGIDFDKSASSGDLKLLLSENKEEVKEDIKDFSKEVIPLFDEKGNVLKVFSYIDIINGKYITRDGRSFKNSDEAAIYNATLTGE